MTMYSKLFRNETTRAITTTANSSLRLWRAASHLAGVAHELRHIRTPIDKHSIDESVLTAQRLSIAVTHLLGDFSIKGVVLFIVSAAAEFGYTIMDLLGKLADICYEIPQLSKQLHQTIGSVIEQMFSKITERPEIEQTAQFASVLASFSDPESIATLTSLVGALSAMVATSLVGVSTYKPTRPMLSNLASFGSEISKLNNGYKSLIDLISNFSRLVYDQVLSFYGTTPSSMVVAAVTSLKMEKSNGDYLTAEELFKDLVFYLSDDGEQIMSVSKDHLKKAKFCSHVINELVTGSISKRFDLSGSATTHLLSLQRTLDYRVKIASTKTLAEKRRRTPFCIWLYGKPGIGKSETMAKLSSSIMANLGKHAEYFEVPNSEQHVYACSFGQEFRTGYKEHYIFQVDDAMQDKEGSTRGTPLTMDIIQWVSCIPVNVNQAALEDKSCPFDSKILMISSNEGYPVRSSEINHKNALRRRRHMLIECTLSDEDQERLRQNPGCERTVLYTLRDSLNANVPGEPYASFEDLLKNILKRFKEHFDHENFMMKQSAQPTDVNMNEIMGIREPVINNSDAEHSSDQANIISHDPAETENVAGPSNLTDLTPTWQEHSLDEQLSVDVQNGYGRISVPIHIADREVDDDPMVDGNQIVRALFNVSDLDLPDYWLRYIDDVNHYVWCSPIDAGAEMSVPRNYLRHLLEDEHHEVDLTDDVITYDDSYVGNCCADIYLEPTFSFFGKKDSVPAENLFLQECLHSAVAISSWIEKIQAKWNWKIVAAIGTATTILGGYYVKNKLWPSYYDIELTYDKSIIRAKPKPVVKPNQLPTLQPTVNDFVSSVQNNNVVRILTKKGNANGMFVKGRMLLTCRHVLMMIAEGEQFNIQHGNVEYRQSFDPRRMQQLEGCRDVAVYACDFTIPQFKDITSKFIKEDSVMPEYFWATIASQAPEKQQYTFQYRTGTVERVMRNPDNERVSIVKYFEGSGITGNGCSGSPLIVHENVSRAPGILGIQFAQSKGEASTFVEPVCYELLMRTITELEPTIGLFTSLVEEEDIFFDCDDNYEEFIKAVRHTVHFVSKETPVHMPTKTNLRRSEIADTFMKDPNLKQYAPAALSGKSPGVAPENASKDPLLVSMQGFGLPSGAFDRRIGSVVLSDFQQEDKIVRRCPDISMRLLSNDEILNGIPGILKGVEMSTSPGLPYVRTRKRPGKRDWITMDDSGVRTMSKDVWDDIARLEELAIDRNPDSGLISYACLKDELRPVERVAQGKTRTFIVLPMHYNLLLRKYFGTWIAIQHKLAGKISSCVGIDANSQWDIIYNRLTEAGSDMEDFDYSDWDRTLHAEWFLIYADRVSAAYEDKPGSNGWKVRRSLMEYLVHMQILVRDFVILTHGGNKSGCAITAEINSDVHDMLMYYVWYKLAKERKDFKMLSLARFRANCAMVVYGDDIIKSTNPDVTCWFNGNNIKRIVKELGMNITPASKTETEFKVRNINEVTFLKRSFVVVNDDCGLVRAPLDKSVIQRMVLWTHKNDDNIAATKVNVEGACREAFYWGERYYNEFKDECVSAWAARAKGCRILPPLDVPSYAVMEDAYRARNWDWSPVLFN